MSWLRLHDRVIDDPKVDKLSLALFKGWIKSLCLACKNSGALPRDLADVAYAFRMPERKTRKLLDGLIKAGLLDECEDQLLRPHDWADWQYQSDVSTERVKRFRERKRNVSETPPDQIRTDADAEAEQSRTDPLAVFLLPEEIPAKTWESFLEMRRKKRASPTEHAKVLLVKKLLELKALGYDPGKVLEQSITSNWTDVFPLRGVHGRNGSGKTGRVDRGFEEIVERDSSTLSATDNRTGDEKRNAKGLAKDPCASRSNEI